MGCPVSVLRLQNVYGVGQSLDNPYTGVLSIFAKQALSGSPINVYEDGNIVRDFVYVDDAAEAICSAIDRPPTTARTLDIGSGSSTTILDAATLVASLSDAPDPVVTGDFRDGDVRAASTTIDAGPSRTRLLTDLDALQGSRGRSRGCPARNRRAHEQRPRGPAEDESGGRGAVSGNLRTRGDRDLDPHHPVTAGDGTRPAHPGRRPGHGGPPGARASGGGGVDTAVSLLAGQPCLREAFGPRAPGPCPSALSPLQIPRPSS